MSVEWSGEVCSDAG